MKQIFAIICSLFMLACMSIGDVVIAKTSETTLCGPDFDVGFCITETSAATVATQYPDFSETITCAVPGASMNTEAIHATAISSAYKATTCAPTITSAVTLRQQKQPDKPWEGGNTKSSPCKAVLFTYIQDNPRFVACLPFGRDIRRLPCEAKA